MSNNNIMAILFDKDGVLVDFQATYGGSTREIIRRLSAGDDVLFQSLAAEIGFNISNNYIDPNSPLVGGCALDICGVWAGVLGVNNSREFQINVDDMFKELTGSGVVLIDGVGTVLQDLNKSYQLGLATNDMEACARAQLTHSGIIDNFGFLSGYDTGHGPKPETGMAEAFFKYTNLTSENVVMVGDSAHDMHFAKAAGMISIGVSTGPLPADELVHHADHMLGSLDELPQFLDRL